MLLLAELMMTNCCVHASRPGICFDSSRNAPSEKILRLDIDLDGDCSISTHVLGKIIQQLNEAIVIEWQPVAIAATCSEVNVVETRDNQMINGSNHSLFSPSSSGSMLVICPPISETPVSPKAAIRANKRLASDIASVH